MEIGIGTKLRDLLKYCQSQGLESPYFMECDLDKTMWRLIKENSLTMANLFPYIRLTESLLFDGTILCSSSLEAYGKELFDIKGIMLAENDNISVINKLHLKFPKKSYSLESRIRIEPGSPIDTGLSFHELLHGFNKEWRDDIRINISQKSQDGAFKHLLKVSSVNRNKVGLNQED